MANSSMVLTLGERLMEDRLTSLGLGPRRSAVVASMPHKILCVLWLLSGRRPGDQEDTSQPIKARAVRT